MTHKEAIAHVNTFTFLAISDATSLVNKIYEDVSITNGDLIGLIQRAFLIMEEENFFEPKEDGPWYSSLHTDMKKIIDGNPYRGWYGFKNKIIEQQSEKIQSLEAKIKELESPPKQEVQTIRKGQVFVSPNHGRVVFERLDFYYGECTAQLRGVDHSGTYYPKLETLPEFQFIDN